ncbi:hypothetical protein ARMSODRAFT_974255 [Armillaria solidipes]|uniref:Uncharacterized protein n=1 Tax=Armillaria solidipes TaxID=1076256 RepID=A0A2H3BTF8_9AGAR|nr:hypothetical protein ARMSODRAFT_974255 [Armillaria solidipes]
MAMLGYYIINTLHPEVKRLLFRMMINWGCNSTQVNKVQDDLHIPNWQTRDGLLSLITLGNKYDPAAMIEWLIARDTYAIAVAQFDKHYSMIDCMNISLESVKQFAVSIWDYLEMVEEELNRSPEAAGAHHDYVEEVFGEVLDFDLAKDILKWEVEDSYFKDSSLLA